MKTSKIAILAIVVWLITVAALAASFIRGQTVTGTDGRTAILMGAGEREFVLGEMRSLLAATHEILEGLSSGDMKQVAQAGHHAGKHSAVDVNPTMLLKAPLEFKKLGLSVHGDMDDLAVAADSGKPPAELYKRLNDILSKCVACHAAWQIKLE